MDYYSKLLNALEPLYGKGEASSIARIVVEDVPDLESRFENILARLLSHEPVQYILGQADFYGLKIEVNPGVLIPRQETEELVFEVLEACKGEDLANKHLLDIGSGSGCIPIVLKKKLPALEVVSVDISQEALEVARRNAEKHQAEIDWRCLDFLNPANWPSLGAFDLIVSNPPYIDPSEKGLMPAHVTGFEPHLALFTRDNPMEFYRAIALFARKYLASGGKIFLECNEFRLEEAMLEFGKQAFKQVEGLRDLSGNPRIIKVLA